MAAPAGRPDRPDCRGCRQRWSACALVAWALGALAGWVAALALCLGRQA